MAFDANDLTPIEIFVVDRTRDGEIADFTPMIGADGVKPLIRAGFLRRLLLGLHPEWVVRMPGVRVRGARIEGALDLADCSGAGGAGLPALELLACDLPLPVDFSHARLSRLSLRDSAVSEVTARTIVIDGPLDLRGVHAAAETAWINAASCRIGGDLLADGAQLAAPAPRAETESGRRIYALRLRNAVIGGGVFFGDGFEADGGVNLDGAAIAGGLSFRGARLREGERDALRAQGARVQGDVSFGGDAHFFGPVVLEGAEIGGDVRLKDARFETPGRAALALDTATIAGALIGACKIDGRLALRGAHIGRNLDLRGAELVSPAPRTGAPHALEFDLALDATNARIGGGLFLQGARIKGEALLADARVEGYCAFGGGRFLNPGGWAIRAPNIRIGGNLTFKSGGADDGPIATKTVIEGGAKFDRARIEGEATWDGLELRGKTERNAPSTLSFADAEIGRALAARNLSAQQALIDLTGLRCAALEDDLAKGWGMASTQIALDGFSYERIECSPDDLKWAARTRWLRTRAHQRSPQPYAALARVYAAMGRQDDMRRALRAQHEAQARAGAGLTPTGAFSWLFGFLSGYGLSPTRAAATLSAFLLIGMVGVFAMDQRGALVTPQGRACAGAVEPILYAIDVALPVIDLGQESACAPGHAQGADLFAGIALPRQHWRIGEEVALWRWGQALYAILGAVLTALAILTFSGVMKPGKDD